MWSITIMSVIDNGTFWHRQFEEITFRTVYSNSYWLCSFTKRLTIYRIFSTKLQICTPIRTYTLYIHTIYNIHTYRIKTNKCLTLFRDICFLNSNSGNTTGKKQKNWFKFSKCNYTLMLHLKSLQLWNKSTASM